MDTHTHTQQELYVGQQVTSSEILLVEVEAEVFTLSFDDFSQSRRAAVEHVHFAFILLGHLLKHLTHTHTHTHTQTRTGDWGLESGEMITALEIKEDEQKDYQWWSS